MVPRPNGLARQPWHSDNLCSTIWMQTSRMVVFSVFYRWNAPRTYSFCFFYTLEVNEHSYWFVFLHFCSLFWGKQGVNKWINSFPPKKNSTFNPDFQLCSSGRLDMKCNVYIVSVSNKFNIFDTLNGCSIQQLSGIREFVSGERVWIVKLCSQESRRKWNVFIAS